MGRYFVLSAIIIKVDLHLKIPEIAHPEYACPFPYFLNSKYIFNLSQNHHYNRKIVTAITKLNPKSLQISIFGRNALELG